MNIESLSDPTAGSADLRRVTLYGAACSFEYLADDVANLGALIGLAAHGENVPSTVSQALSCVVARLTEIAQSASELSEIYLAGSKAERNDRSNAVGGSSVGTLAA